ncbi:MAG: hypothetical protein ACLQDV_17350 [Candidatus Binataceae bacterium]
MTLRHAAALAAVGWYIMLPAQLSYLARDGPIKPVRNWIVIGEFRTKRDCNAERPKFWKLDPNLGPYRGLPAEEIYDVQCVATDDPRLKEK